MKFNQKIERILLFQTTRTVNKIILILDLNNRINKKQPKNKKNYKKNNKNLKGKYKKRQWRRKEFRFQSKSKRLK